MRPRCMSQHPGHPDRRRSFHQDAALDPLRRKHLHICLHPNLYSLSHLTLQLRNCFHPAFARRFPVRVGCQQDCRARRLQYPSPCQQHLPTSMVVSCPLARARGKGRWRHLRGYRQRGRCSSWRCGMISPSEQGAVMQAGATDEEAPASKKFLEFKDDML